ncbi:MAG: hypothetical protein SGARI_005388, partial [Bacillariaceae sp.]
RLPAESVASMIMFAETWSCPLLKEAAIAKYKEDPRAVMQSEEWQQIAGPAQLLNEILFATNVLHEWVDDDVAHKKSSLLTETDISTMSVGTLRDRLHNAGHSLLGSRDDLIQRLMSLFVAPPPVAAAATQNIAESSEEDNATAPAAAAPGMQNMTASTAAVIPPNNA